MGRLGLAFKAFFRIFGDADFSKAVEQTLAGKRLSVAPAPEAVVEPPKPAPGRSDALNLLSALQREARFLDFIQEPISEYTDAQVGAAVRDIHRDCASVIQRMFAPEPVVSQEEGAAVEVAEGYDPAEYRLSGNISAESPHHGTLGHHGWKASRCELPQWTGKQESASIVAPAEVEIP